jgi:hypothetical protein
MNKRVKSIGEIAVRSIPLVVSVVLASAHPAMASLGSATGALSGITTGANEVQTSMQYVGMIACIIGIAIGGLHWVQHRDDWMGAGSRVLAGIIGGLVVSNAANIATMGGGATF